MKIQTLFEPVTIWQFGPFAVVRTKEQKELLRRLRNAEVGFDYAVSREIPRIQSSRDSHMLNAQKLREELAELKAQAIEARRAATGNTDAVADESAVGNADAPRKDDQ